MAVSVSYESLISLDGYPGLRLLISGERCTGKTALGLDLAQRWGGVFVGSNSQAQMSALAETVADEIALGAETTAQNRADLRKRVESVAERFRISHLLGRNPLALSGGQTQLTLLAAHWVLGNPVLIIDEPLSGLDRRAAERVLDMISDYPASLVWLSARPTLAELNLASHRLELRAGEAKPGIPDPFEPELTPAVLEVSQLAVGLRTGRSGWSKPTVPVAQGITFSTDPGNVYAVTGANGTGKTTLLRTLAGLIPPLEGTFTVGGNCPRELSARCRVSQVSLAAQEPGHHFLTSTVEEEMRIGGAVNCPGDYRQHLLEMIGLAESLESHPHDLSPVEQHLLALATALAARPSCLLLDEPTARLDSTGLTQTVALIQEYCSAGGTVLLATHDRQLLELLEHQEINLDRSCGANDSAI